MATTEIYTLSLHDALPICQSAAFDFRADMVGKVFVNVCKRFEVALGVGRRRARRRFGIRAKVAQAGAIHLHRLDRKSTRLNSSHPSISYAVFCLKKKKPIA